MLLLTAPVRESAVVSKDLRIEPAAAGRLSCQGKHWGELVIPFLAVVGEAEVWLSRLTVYGLACGPQATLRLSDVQILPDKLVLTGRAKVDWEGGYGGLKLRRHAQAEVKRVHLVLGVELHDRARASLQDCDPVAAPVGEAIELDGLAELVGSGLVVRGGISVGDWARLSLSRSLVSGPPTGREWGARAVISLGPFVQVELQETVVHGGVLGIALNPSGKPRLVLDDVSIEDAHIGLAINIRCPELYELYGLWLPPLSPYIELGPRGISFKDCDSNVCPTCSLEPWPPGFCLAAGLEPREPPAEARDLIEKVEGVHTLRARYRVRHFPATDTGQLTEYELSWADPDEFRLVVRVGREGGADRIIVCDGERLWHYYPRSGAVYVVDLARVRRECPEAWQETLPDVVRSLSQGDLAGVYLPSAIFLGTEVLDGVRTYLFEGLPARGALAGVTRARVWIGEDGLWRRIEYYAGEEFYQLRELEVLELNEEIPDGEFTVELPSDVQVYDVTEQVLLELR